MSRHPLITDFAALTRRAWLLIAYPRLREVPAGEWPAVLERARAVALDLTERLAILVGIGFTTYLLQSIRTDPQHLFAHYLLQFALALPLIAILVGPFLVRRTRRGLDLEVTRRYGGDQCTSTALIPARKQAGSERGS